MKNAVISNYKANSIPVETILTYFFVSCGALALITLLLTLIANKQPLSLTTRLTAIWFAICAAIHMILEGYFVINASSIASDSFFFAQVWKEYAHSDSRYLTGDLTV